jgi:putative ATPase
VERGIVTLIGATTENPFFSVNAPLVSRSQVFQFEPLSSDLIVQLMRRALTDGERGLGHHRVEATEDALQHLALVSDGDARRALSALEVAVLSQAPTAGAGPITVDLSAAQDSIQRKAIRYDRLGDEHYDAASALIKSMRGSDPDAAVYWLARMLGAGEDPRFIARRVAICAAEDIGNADPQALVLANAAFQVTLQVGMPECQLALAQAVIYLACAPKSNAAARAIWQAAEDVREDNTIPVPKHLRDASYAGAGRLGHGEDYQYPHDSADGFAEQDYLGVDKTYYHPTDRGHEATIRAYLAKLARRRGEAGET